jgi:hypothetical protein
MVWVCERTIPTERPPIVGEVIANLCDKKNVIQLIIIIIDVTELLQKIHTLLLKYFVNLNTWKYESAFLFWK